MAKPKRPVATQIQPGEPIPLEPDLGLMLLQADGQIIYLAHYDGSADGKWRLQWWMGSADYYDPEWIRDSILRPAIDRDGLPVVFWQCMGCEDRGHKDELRKRFKPRLGVCHACAKEGFHEPAGG